MKRSTTFTHFFSLLALFGTSTSFALSPLNPLDDIKWDVNPDVPGNQGSAPGIEAGSVEAVEAAFTNARRAEEAQLGITANALGALNLPSQSRWDTMTASEKGLMLTNAERTARDGVNYPGHGVVLGLPLEAVESHLNKLAEDYAEYMASNNFWAHDVPGNITAPPFANSGSYNRISNHPIIGDNAVGADCRQFINSAENLYISASSVQNGPMPKTLIESALYGFLYDDKSSNWGHRTAMFIQDESIYRGSGFNNDHGPGNSEGFMGIGFAGRGDGSYSFFDGNAYPTQWNVVWLVMDPADDPACNYGIPSKLSLPEFTWQTISLPATPPESANTVADIFGDDIPGDYGSTWRVWAWDASAGTAGDYFDPGSDGVLETGRAYWIIQGTGSTVSLDMPIGSNRTQVAEGDACMAPLPGGCREHALTASASGQWNMLGNPFYTRPSVDSFRVTTTAGICADTDGCSMTEAADESVANVEQSVFWKHDESGYTAIGPGQQMEPWVGYWNAVLPGGNGASPALHIPRN
ncbi:MAG: hypothetical protein AB8B97_10150 [Granulosicoccus sp.]